ncbi:MAG: M20/M25/M40 family metallo-hydrolase [Proteobacteria bacterium]|nr:M20/M25/M40 family metallo-hydrolase [Pseudomonadota bacterium]
MKCPISPERFPSRSLFTGSVLALLASAFLPGVAEGSPGPDSTRAPAGKHSQVLASPSDDEYTWISLGADALSALDRAGLLLLTDVEQRVDVVDDISAVRVRRADLHAIASTIHEELNRCGGFMMHSSYQDSADAILASALPQPPTAARLAEYTVDNREGVEALIDELDESNLISTITALSSYQNRLYNSVAGVQAAQSLADKWRTFSAARADASVGLINHSQFPQPSVVLTITGASQPDEIVVIGGHLDSIAFDNNGNDSLIAPGADDNASGIAAISEVARAVLETGYRPARTIEFYGYAGEEIGLVGSADIARQARVAGHNIVGVLQLDMVNYKGPSSDIVLINDNTDVQLSNFVAQLIDTYVGGVVLSDSCGYACSDHASWHRQGFAAALPHEARVSEHNPAIHTPGDTIDRSAGRAEHAMKFTKIAAAFVAELGKGSLPVDGQDPQNGNDQGGGGQDGGDNGSPANNNPGSDPSLTSGCRASAATGPGSGSSLAALVLLGLAIVCRRYRRKTRTQRATTHSLT